MNIQEKKEYFNIIIHKDNTYSIDITEKKPKAHELALSTLNAMEKIIKGDLKYSTKDENDHYLQLSKSDLYELLMKKSIEIDENYSKAALKSNWLYKMIFNKEKLVHAASTRIENLVNPPGLTLVDDMLQHELSKYLDQLI